MYKNSGDKDIQYHNFCQQPLESKNNFDYCPKCDVYVLNEGHRDRFESKNIADITNLVETLEMENSKRTWNEECIRL